jgi:hypothetical protein
LLPKKPQKAALLTLLFDFIRDLIATLIFPQGQILQTMGKIAKFVAFLPYWRENRLFPVSPNHANAEQIFRKKSVIEACGSGLKAT